ncbi:MAG: hypothetical protein IH991_10530 [Planctomycetes bacterium]|nr:hypothetical protein [Planctomycetota bacterium]
MTMPQEDDHPRGLEPPQFRLSTLLWVVAFLCAIFALMATVGPMAAWGLILLVLAVFAHVAGNSLGTKLRDNGDQTVTGDRKSGRASLRRKIRRNEFAPATNLSERYSLGITTIIITGTGAILGVILGGGFLALANLERLNWASLTVAGVASGVIGGLFGFLISGFVYVTLIAYFQAMRHEKRK